MDNLNFFSYVGCYLCGWQDGALDHAHVIAKKDGGPNEDWNFIFLCPNCHRLYDRDELTKEAQVKMDPVVEYAKDLYEMEYEDGSPDTRDGCVDVDTECSESAVSPHDTTVILPTDWLEEDE